MNNLRWWLTCVFCFNVVFFFIVQIIIVFPVLRKHFVCVRWICSGAGGRHQMFLLRQLFLWVSLLFRKLLRTGIFYSAACKSCSTSKSWRAASSTRWSQWNSANTFQCVSDNLEGYSVNWLHVSRENATQVSMWPSSHFSLNQIIVFVGVYSSIHFNRFKKCTLWGLLLWSEY